MSLVVEAWVSGAMTEHDAVEQAGKPTRARLERSVTSVVMLAGGMSAVLLWSLTMNDPYWRLFDGDPVPAPIYATVGPTFGFPARYGPGLDPLADVSRPSPALAVVNVAAATVSEPTVSQNPMSSVSRPFSPQMPITTENEVGGAAPAQALAVRAGVDEATHVAIALEPVSMSSPSVFRDRELGGLGRLSAMVAPAASMQPPLPPHFAADPSTEAALELNQSDRAEVQQRLALAGFDPRGADGVFGPRTRVAIREAQAAWGYPTTGYLEPALYADLGRRTEDALQDMQRHSRIPRAAPEPASTASEQETAEVDPGACARGPNGRIIERQSIKCDLAGFKESFGAGGKGFATDGETTGGRATTYVER